MTQYRDLRNILSQRGLSSDLPTEEEVEKLSESDLLTLIRVCRDTARTPER
jgi:hypothetical protein